MPRKSAEASLVQPLDGSPPQLEPPASLSPPEAQLFRDLIAAVDRKHFRSSDLALLCRYVEACVLAEQAAKELREGAVIDGKPSGWLIVQEKCVRTLTALSSPGDRGHRDCAGGALGLAAGPGRPARAQRARAHGRCPAYARLARSRAERALPFEARNGRG